MYSVLVIQIRYARIQLNKNQYIFKMYHNIYDSYYRKIYDDY